MKSRKIFQDITIRYCLLILAGLFNLQLFYWIFTPLTVYLSYFFLNIFFGAYFAGNIIIVKNLSIALIPACIAGSAYYLLFILNLSVPGISIRKRLAMISFAFVAFLTANVFRIFILSCLAVSDFSFFDITHKLFWYLVSIVFVVGIWFLEVKFFSIKEIPFYSDLKSVYKVSSLKRG